MLYIICAKNIKENTYFPIFFHDNIRRSKIRFKIGKSKKTLFASYFKTSTEAEIILKYLIKKSKKLKNNRIKSKNIIRNFKYKTSFEKIIEDYKLFIVNLNSDNSPFEANGEDRKNNHISVSLKENFDIKMKLKKLIKN